MFFAVRSLPVGFVDRVEDARALRLVQLGERVERAVGRVGVHDARQLALALLVIVERLKRAELGLGIEALQERPRRGEVRGKGHCGASALSVIRSRN
ncbi:MAG: hypothetical protein IPJ62_11740 [Betaproteobacteria bacterium]|nr:hypothetical protein [Betaproteobacteria bacterium]